MPESQKTPWFEIVAVSLLMVIFMAFDAKDTQYDAQPTIWTVYTSPEYCPPCKKLENMLREPDVLKLLADNNVQVEIVNLDISTVKTRIPYGRFNAGLPALIPTQSKDALKQYILDGL